MHFYIIRHGRRLDEYPGSVRVYNTPLSDIGHQQAEALAEWLGGRRLHAIYSSCMLRAIQTALPLQRKTGLPLQIWPVLCESIVDTWQEKMNKHPEDVLVPKSWYGGVPYNEEEALEEKRAKEEDYHFLSEFPSRFPSSQLTQPFPWAEAWWKPLERETREEGFARAELAGQALLSRHRDDEYVAVICHGNLGDKLLRYLLGLDRFQYRCFSMDETAVSWVEVTERGLRLMHTINSLEHLPAHLQPEWRTAGF
jgi:broad specificity phosphatase PhoE